MPLFDPNDVQGGKNYGEYKKEIETGLDKVNQIFRDDPKYIDVEDLEEQLISYKAKFMEYDIGAKGNLDMQDLKYMMEKLGQAKTHLELKKMIKEVDTTDTGTINYYDFITMMLGPQSAVLKIILLFEARKNLPEKPTGPPPKRSLDSLP